LTADRLGLLSRRNCPLCESARSLLIELAGSRQLAVSEYDIDEDPRLQRQFTDRVPVILYRGRVLAEGRVEPNQLRAALDGIGDSEPAAADDSVTEPDPRRDRG
jgi:hypothetical protein